jgi:hypothetical protein
LNVLIALLLVGIAACNLVASVRSLRDQFSVRHERVAHLLLIWCLPVAGALLVFFMLRDGPETTSGCYPNEPDVGDEYVADFGRPNDRGYMKSPDDVFHSTSTQGGESSHD